MFVQNAADEKPMSIRFAQQEQVLPNTLTFKTENLQQYPVPIADILNYTAGTAQVVQAMFWIF